MSDRFHVATRKGLFSIGRDETGGWGIQNISFLGDNCTLVMHDPRPALGPEGTLFAALDHGHYGVKLHRSADGGREWQEIAVPVYPEKPVDYQPKMPPMEGVPYDWALKLIWALAPGGREQDGRIWCGTLPGGLFRSDDHGKTWELNRPLWDHPKREAWFGGGADYPALHSICVNPADPNHILIAVSCGGVWGTRDGGRSWECGGKGMRADFFPPEMADDPNIQDPHLLVQCESQPEALWVQHHNGIYRSTDGAASWQEIPEAGPSTFGFAVAVHPREPGTAWFVPSIKDEQRIPVGGQVVVTRTRDGGESFETLTKGLPQEHAYDLVYRHALDIDGSGERLAFGSTTGSLWVSEDGGDSWETVSNHLPPIHAVRFEKGVL